MRTKKLWVLSEGHCKMTNCKYAKFKDGKYFPQSLKKKVIMTSSFDKKNLSEEPFALEMKIHWDKRKGVLRLWQSILRKGF